MKGKIAFVLGAAVGYVLGTRAGRERYEQIKRGAEKVWHTEPVQKGVDLVRGTIDDRAEDVKSFLLRASSDAFATLSKQAGAKSGGSQTDTDTRPQDASKTATTKDADKKDPKTGGAS